MMLPAPNDFRTNLPGLIALVCGAAIVFFSGCATTSPGVASSLPPSAAAPLAPAPGETRTPASEVPPAPPTPSSAVDKPTTSPSPASIPTPVPPAPASSPPAIPVALPAATIPVGRATIRGSQETSILFDNFTAFVAAVDGKKISGGREGWNVPVSVETGKRILDVEFNRGVFVARSRLELEAMANASYELHYTTDAEVFGQNSFCDFWLVDAGTGRTVTPVRKAAVEKQSNPETSASLSK